VRTPANKPTVEERDGCLPYVREELDLLGEVRVILALGKFGWDAACRMLGARPIPRFVHGMGNSPEVVQRDYSHVFREFARGERVDPEATIRAARKT